MYETEQYKGHAVGKSFYRKLNDDLTRTLISLFGYSRNLDERLYMRYDFTKDIWVKEDWKTIDTQSSLPFEHYNVYFQIL